MESFYLLFKIVRIGSKPFLFFTKEEKFKITFNTVFFIAFEAIMLFLMCEKS